MKHLLIIFSLLAFITPAHAQSSKADRAIQCAAIYHIATAFVGGNKQAAKAFTNIQSTFEGVFRANEGQRLKKGITNGYTSKKKAEIAVLLGKKYDKDPKSVYAIEMQCNAWRLKLLPYLKSKIARATKDIKTIRSAFLSAPDAPAIPSASNPRWSQSKMMMDKSFTAWNKTGRMTTQKFKQKLLDSLKKDKPYKEYGFGANPYDVTKPSVIKPKEETKPKENFFSQFDKEEEKNKKIIKDKISKCMFKNVKKVTNALQYSIVQKECKRRAEASTK